MADFTDNKLAVGSIIAFLFGSLIKVLDYLFRRKSHSDDLATQLRSELHTEVRELSADNDLLEAELDIWKQKYWDQMAQLTESRIQLGLLLPKEPIDVSPEPMTEIPPPEFFD